MYCLNVYYSKELTDSVSLSKAAVRSLKDFLHKVQTERIS